MNWVWENVSLHVRVCVCLHDDPKEIFLSIVLAEDAGLQL